MSNPILARADALMHRKRHDTAEAGDIPVLTDAVDQDDELPILLDVITSEDIEAGHDARAHDEAAAVEPTEKSSGEAEPVSDLDTAKRERIVREIARRVEERLAAELPRIIEAVVGEFLSSNGTGRVQRSDD